MKRRVLSVLLACMIGIGAFFGSYEKAHAGGEVAAGLGVITALIAAGVTFSDAQTVQEFWTKYQHQMKPIADEIVYTSLPGNPEGHRIALGVTEGLINAIRSFWKENNVEIQSQFGGNIENGIWKGTAELSVDHNNYVEIPSNPLKRPSWTSSNLFSKVYNLGNVQLLFGVQNSSSSSFQYFFCGVSPYNPKILDRFSFDLSFHRTCFYPYVLSGDSPMSTYVKDVRYHYAEIKINSDNYEYFLSNCMLTDIYIRYVGENSNSYLYEQTCTCWTGNDSDSKHTDTQTFEIDKTVVGQQITPDVTLDDVNKKLDELKEGQWFVAPDTNGSISENPGDYAGLTADDVIFGGGAVNPNQCICSDDVINKACPLHGIGCPDCICVGNDYAKDCPVHGSLVDTDVNTGILSDIYAGVRSIANTLTDALAGVGEGVYTGVKEIAATLKDMFKPSDFDLSFDGFKSIGLSDKFPFCIPFDFYDCIAVWSADASNYKLKVNVKTDFWKVNHTVDMSQFSTPIKFFRLFCIVIFSYILITRTRSLMKW